MAEAGGRTTDTAGAATADDTGEVAAVSGARGSATKPAPTRNTDIVTGKAAADAAKAEAEAREAAARQAAAREAAARQAGPRTEAMPPTSATVGRVPTVAPVAVPPPGAAPAAVPAAAVQQAPRGGGVRRARLMVTRLDPWSVLKSAFMLSLSFAVILLVATALLWYVLDVLRVFDTLGRTVNDITGTGTTQFDLGAVISFGRVMGVALVIAAFEIILVSVIATMFAFLYNLTVGITGGLEVTLSEDSSS